MAEPGPRYTAGDVPGLRRDLADWYGGTQGTQFYYNAILMGQQQLKPPGPPERVAPALAAAETARLRDGDLWYVDEDLCALLNAAHPSMPAFAPRPTDLPSKTGFAVFAEPIAAYDAQEARRDDIVDALADMHGGDEFRRIGQAAYEDQARIVAVSWGPVDNPHWKAGGLWMSFYAVTDKTTDDLLAGHPAAAARARAMLPPLPVDNEAAIAWRPDGAPPEEYMLTGADDQHGTLAWTRLVFATFQLAAQANLAETEDQTTPRPERRRTERAGLPPRDVRVIRLRRTVAAARDAEQAGAGRDWQHRWIVRGHWRNQWYPSLGDHRPLWIAPYLKGPTDAPLLGGDKVNVITAPKDHDQDRP
ncbi:hypothetical protein Q0Z83_031780 [Actinoplanes sichuanensis]|uniref:Uncharacterized protein n=1 Tax=Actinoplanes sichuanensis TaxID=512349 RepID=A0ABW4ASK0_9ACTN|nr:hypothetical protein [Actinoplanes sichuanensis]BEL04987.1 hypothetical protein Q0Z83_031780 [Actinoplanes sichuanensis]